MATVDLAQLTDEEVVALRRVRAGLALRRRWIEEGKPVHTASGYAVDYAFADITKSDEALINAIIARHLAGDAGGTEEGG